MKRLGRLGVLVCTVLLGAAWFNGGLALAQPLGQADQATADRLAALEKSGDRRGANIRR